MALVGRYINMDASPERRAAMEAQFERLGCADRFQRFTAVDGRALDLSRTPLSAGELGCFMSHYRCIVEAASIDAHLHIVEDDVVFGDQTLGILDQVIEDGTANSDLLFTDLFMPMDFSVLYAFMRQLRASGLLERRGDPPRTRAPAFVMFQNLRNDAFGATASYIVNRRARGKLIALLEAEIAAGPTQPIDMAYRAFANSGRLEAVCTVPFLTSVDPARILDHTITGRSQDAETAMAFYVLRSFFYVARDDAQLAGIMAEVNAGLADPDFVGPLLEFFRFFFSERYRMF
jgi:GR25 family glycosyltransferase involved in LPS biosynthesis